MAPRSSRTALRSCVVLLASASVLASSPAPRSTPVVARAFIGTYIEDIDIVRTGPRTNFLVATEGDGIYGAPLDASGHGLLRKLADYRGVLDVLPRGLAYLDDERAFAVVDGAACSDLAIFDAANGNYLGRRTVQHLDGFAPDYCEGLARIPDGAASFAGDLLLAAMDTTNGLARIEVLQPNGQVVREIVPPDPASAATLSAVVVNESGAILVGVDGVLDDGDAQIWTIDFDGNELAPRVTLDQGFVEGMARASDGRIFVTGNRSEIHAYDASLQRLASGDRDYQLGFGWTVPRGIAWNSAAGQFEIGASDGVASGELVSMAPALDAATPIVNLSTVTDGSGTPWFPGEPGALAYVASTDRIVVANPAGPLNRRGLFFFDGAALTARVQLSGLAQTERPMRVEYLASTNELLVGLRGSTDGSVRAYSPAGAFVREFDPRPTAGVAINGFAAFPAPDGSDRLLFFFTNDQALITDASGNALGGFNWRTTLGVMEPSDLAYIAGGPNAGAFAVTEASPGSVTIFTLP